MSMAILKSPIHVQQRMTLGGTAPRQALPEQALPDPRKAIEAELMAKLEAEFAAKLDAARDEARAEGYKEGLATGHEDGMTSALESFKKKQALLERVLEKAESEVDGWLLSVDEQAMTIATQALVQLLGEQAMDVGALQAIIKRMTANLRDADVRSIRLFPAECQTLRAALKQASAAGAAGISRIADRLVEDESLVSGGVVVDTPRGEYRATLDVQLRKLLNLVDAQRARSEAGAKDIVHAIRA